MHVSYTKYSIPKYTNSVLQWGKKEGIFPIFSTSPILPLDLKLDTQYKDVKSHTIQISRTLTSKKDICKPN